MFVDRQPEDEKSSATLFSLHSVLEFQFFFLARSFLLYLQKKIFFLYIYFTASVRHKSKKESLSLMRCEESRNESKNEKRADFFISSAYFLRNF